MFHHPNGLNYSVDIKFLCSYIIHTRKCKYTQIHPNTHKYAQIHPNTHKYTQRHTQLITNTHNDIRIKKHTSK